MVISEVLNVHGERTNDMSFNPIGWYSQINTNPKLAHLLLSDYDI